MVNDSFFDIVSHMHPPLPLEVLEFGFPSLDASVSFSTSSLVTAMDYGLANLRSVGFHEVFCTNKRIMEDEEIDELLYNRFVKANQSQSESLQNGVEKSDYSDSAVGVYYI